MKRMLRVFLILLMFCGGVLSVSAKEFNITSDNVILYNLNDKDVLYELDSEEKVNIASLTKIMTAIVAIENISNLDEEVVITKEIFKGIYDYSKMGLKVGNKVTYRDLLYGILLPSGADAVNAVAINMSGSIDEFVVLMNNKAKELGLVNTNFDNPIGMDSDNNYSTAKDVSKILLYALENETFREIFYTKEYTVSNINLTIKSTLLMYSRYQGIDTTDILGAKSGFTDGAGLCLASVSSYNDVNYLLVVLGADTNNRANAVKDTKEIYDYYYSNYSYQKILSSDQVIKKLDVLFGKDKVYELKPMEDKYLYLENSIRKNRIKYIYEGEDKLNYFIKKGDKLGRVKVIYEDRELLVYDLYLNDTLEYYHPLLYLFIGISFIVMVLSFRKIVRRKKRRKRRR